MDFRVFDSFRDVLGFLRALRMFRVLAAVRIFRL